MKKNWNILFSVSLVCGIVALILVSLTTFIFIVSGEGGISFTIISVPIALVGLTAYFIGTNAIKKPRKSGLITSGIALIVDILFIILIYNMYLF